MTKDPREVASMFDEVAEKYDRTNTLISVGQDARWRRAVTRAIGPTKGQIILDLAAGTGASSVPLAAAGAEVVSADFSQGMLDVGAARHPELQFVRADAMDLPFVENTFDAVTMSFGLRNVERPEAALAELYRVTKPGGRVVICEFSHPPVAPVHAAYSVYLRQVLPRAARLFSSDPEAYEYLIESILDWYSQRELAALLQSVGWRLVEYRDLSFGVVAVHRAFKLAE